MGWFKKEKVKAESAQISIDPAAATRKQRQEDMQKAWEEHSSRVTSTAVAGTAGTVWPAHTWPTLGMATTVAKGMTPEMIIKELADIDVMISPSGDMILRYEDNFYDMNLNQVHIVPSRVESVYKQCTVLEFLRKLNDKAKK